MSFFFLVCQFCIGRSMVPPGERAKKSAPQGACSPVDPGERLFQLIEGFPVPEHILQQMIHAVLRVV